jgi:peptidoglycan/LPS O-acetylase OafA/YrhL
MENFRITNTNHKNLDGLRAIGILMVIIVHFFGELINVTLFWTSIDLLFALSGLLISGILIETVDDPKYFRKFYMRRILRIFPLYYLLILLFSVYVFFIAIHPESLAYFKNNIFYFLTYTQNWYFIHAGMPPGGHLNHTWSLAIDEQIYILWPLLIWLCKSEKQVKYLCVFTLLFSLSFRIWYNTIYIPAHPSPHPFPYFHNTFCRVDSFAAGSLLYCLLRCKSRFLTDKNVFIVFAASLVLFLACGIGDESFSRSGFYISNFGNTLAGIHFSTWLYFAIKNRSRFFNYILSNPLIIYIGKISYSLYVFHLFILMLLISRFHNFFIAHFYIRSMFIPLMFCLIITFAVSITSYEYFEKPIIKLKKRYSYKDLKKQD